MRAQVQAPAAWRRHTPHTLATALCPATHPQKLWSLAIPTGPIAAVVPVAELGEAASKVFVASGTHVYGVNRKGKQFFEFHTSLTDAIESMHVEGERLWVTANTVYNVFDAGEDAHFYMAPSPIVGLTVGPAVTDSPHAGVIACVDGVVRVCEGQAGSQA